MSKRRRKPRPAPHSPSYPTLADWDKHCVRCPKTQPKLFFIVSARVHPSTKQNIVVLQCAHEKCNWLKTVQLTYPPANFPTPSAPSPGPDSLDEFFTNIQQIIADSKANADKVFIQFH